MAEVNVHLNVLFLKTTSTVRLLVHYYYYRYHYYVFVLRYDV